MTIFYSLLPDKMKKRVQKRRLNNLVRHAKRSSPYFSRLYKDIGRDFTLSDLPVTTKPMMMENFNDWVTDRDVSMDGIKEFMRDRSNLDRRYLNKYMIANTSGSTGYPATLLHDSTVLNVETIVSVLRTGVMRFPMCMLFVDDDFGAGNGSVRQNRRKLPVIRRFMHLIDSKRPMEQIVAELNRIKPKMITGYPGTVALLADEALEGRLHIRPSLIMVSGEHMAEKTRARIAKAFGCTVRSMYGSTEGGTIAWECRENHFHIHSDWCMLEPVNERFEPVPCGVMSDKALLTNLANRTQPIIRYELTDRIIMHEQPCPCGRKGPWLEVEGRTSDVLYFETAEKRVGVAPMSLFDVIEVVPGVKQFQVLLHRGNRLELRLVCMDGADVREVFEHVRKDVEKYLAGLGIPDAVMYLSETVPQRHPRSGKFKQIYQAS